MVQASEKIIVYDSGGRIIWVQVSRLPMPHPDKDRWKCTMITNYFCIFQYVSSKRSRRYVQNLQHTIIMIVIVKMKEFSLRESSNVRVLCTTYEY